MGFYILFVLGSFGTNFSWHMVILNQIVLKIELFIFEYKSKIKISTYECKIFVSDKSGYPNLLPLSLNQNEWVEVEFH